jgi:cytochrome P450
MLIFTAVLITTAAAWPLVRLLAIGGFRRKLQAFPSAAFALPLLLVSYLALVAVLAVVSPPLLYALAALVVGGAAYAAWLARPGYGRSRALPPGRLALARPDVWRDREFYLREAARYGPIFKVCHVAQPMVCIVDLALGSEVLRRYDDALVAAALPYSRYIPKGFLRYMKPEDRRRYAPLFRAAFSAAVVDGAQPDFRAIVRRELDGMAARCAREGSGGISPTPGLSRMVFAGIARAMFGMDPRDPAVRRLAELYSVLDYAMAWRTTPWRARRTLDEVVRILLDEQRARERDGRPSFVSELTAGASEALDDPTVVYNLAYVMLNGWRDASGLFGWVVKSLGDHPEWRARLRDAAGRPGFDRDLPGRIVRETLRMHQSEYVQRLIQSDIKINGFVAPRGWLLRVCVWEGHRSGKAFTNPDRFDPDRLLGQAYSRPDYTPFGASRVWCIGEHLTLTLTRVLVEQLAAFDWSVTADGPPELGDFHWRPSSKLRIALAPRAASG